MGKPITTVEAGKLGGQKILEKYGIDHFKKLSELASKKRTEKAKNKLQDEKK